MISVASHAKETGAPSLAFAQRRPRSIRSDVRRVMPAALQTRSKSCERGSGRARRARSLRVAGKRRMAVSMAQAYLPYPRWRQLPGCGRVRGLEGGKTGETARAYPGATILLGYNRTARPCSMVKGHSHRQNTPSRCSARPGVPPVHDRPTSLLFDNAVITETLHDAPLPARDFALMAAKGLARIVPPVNTYRPQPGGGSGTRMLLRTRTYA